MAGHEDEDSIRIALLHDSQPDHEAEPAQRAVPIMGSATGSDGSHQQPANDKWPSNFVTTLEDFEKQCGVGTPCRGAWGLVVSGISTIFNSLMAVMVKFLTAGESELNLSSS